MRVAHKGLKIESVSAYELDLLYKSDWSVTRGTPTRYYIDLDPNNKKIHFFPIPQAADAGANMTMEYLKIPPALSADGSIPLDGHTLLTPYHDAIAYWAAASLLNILPDQSALVMISQYENKYIKYVDACIENFDSMGRQRPLNIYREIRLGALYFLQLFFYSRFLLFWRKTLLLEGIGEGLIIERIQPILPFFQFLTMMPSLHRMLTFLMIAQQYG
jgi:hypothetical protein